MPDPTYVTIPDLTAATDGSINDNLLLEAAIPDGGGYVSRKVTKGQLVADLKEDIENISGISDDVKVALLDCFAHVAWTNEHGQDYYDALEEALYAEEPKTLVSISAVYTQSGTVYDTDTLDSLKADLVVTAHYDDSTTATVTTYTLSGTLTEGTSTITVTYGGKTTTFDVVVSSKLLFNWDFTQSLIDTKSSREAILRGTSSAKPTQTSAGLVFDAATQNVNLGEIALSGKTVEVDVASFAFAGNTSSHIRFIMSPNGEVYQQYGQGGLLYKSGTGWCSYGNKTDNTNGWNTYSDAQGNTDAVRNMFSGTTVKLVYSNNTIELFVDGVSKGTVSHNLSVFNTLVIGAGYTSWAANSGDQCYNMTITAVRVYAN